MGRRGGRPRGLGVLPVLRRNRGGVSGVVAASLGVVMISVLLGMVVTFWVPAWGYDNEVAHSRATVNAFAQFKNALELQTLARDTNQTLTTTFPLGVGGVPLFGAETPGQLSHQYLENGRVLFRANLTDSTGAVNFSAAGSLEYVISNRYYVRQEMAYETGAVIVAQSDGETVRLSPPFNFDNGSQGIEVAMTLFSLEGATGGATGVDSHTVSTTLTAADTRAFVFPPNTTLSFNLTTTFLDAWSGYFANTMDASLVNASLFNISRFPAALPESVTLRLSNVHALTLTVAVLQMRID